MTTDPIGETTTESARALLYRHGLPEDVLDGALTLHAQELAARIRTTDLPDWADTVDLFDNGTSWAADLIDPTVPDSLAGTANAEPAAVSSPVSDQIELRGHIAEAIRQSDFREWPLRRSYTAADAVLAVLPPPADRAAVLREAADRLAAKYSDDDPAVEDLRQWADAELRRLAAEAQQQPEAEPHPPHDSWLVEWSADGDEWAVAYPTHDHNKALERLARGRQETPEWQWRLVRETTTYTVEQPAPAAASEEAGRG